MVIYICKRVAEPLLWNGDVGEDRALLESTKLPFAKAIVFLHCRQTHSSKLGFRLLTHWLIFEMHMSSIFFFFFFFLPHHTVFGILVPRPRTKPIPAVEVRSLNHWTAKEGPAHVV